MEYIKIDEDEAQALYRDALDEQGDIKIGSLSYSVSQVLKAVDPIAYRVGFSDFCDAQGIIDSEFFGNN
jgi:hypothetical protein